MFLKCRNQGMRFKWLCIVCRVLRIIFRPKREEVIEFWRISYVDRLYNLYSSPNVIGVSK
jgi:hypothetical protein